MTSDVPPGAARVAASAFAAARRSSDFEPHNCFACGALNDAGIHLELHLESSRAWTEFELDHRFQGWDGIAHGGIIATILDEVMAWALVATDNWGLTARMAIDYRRPVQTGSRLRAEGWIVRARRRVVETGAQLLDPERRVLATATGTYVAADGERRQQLQARYRLRTEATGVIAE